MDDIQEQKRVNARNHYRKNRDLILAKKKIYNEQNKERIKEYRRNYWLAKKERLRLEHCQYCNGKKGGSGKS